MVALVFTVLYFSTILILIDDITTNGERRNNGSDGE